VVFDAGLSAAVVLNTYIGGVKVFLGPALGAALMTFFGYVVSDLTQSWLLYQGILFVLVMMFMPSGPRGPLRHHRAPAPAHRVARLLPLVLLSIAAALLLSMGGASRSRCCSACSRRTTARWPRANPRAPWPVRGRLVTLLAPGWCRPRCCVGGAWC
jgi:branched-chain amino acid transport system permease protein